MRMNIAPDLHAKRRGNVPTNVSFDAELVREAQALGVNISLAAAAGLGEAVAKARAEPCLQDNGKALGSSNAFAERRGLPLQSMRLC